MLVPKKIPTTVEINNLTVGYNQHPALHHINANIPLNELIAIVGNNGSGKSSLIKTMVGELQPIHGFINGLPKTIAYLPQVSGLQRDFPITVFDLIATGLWGRKSINKKVNFINRLFGRMTKDENGECVKAINAVGLQGFEERSIDTLSGGQLQRALFARLIVQGADLILLDEPFIAIDERTIHDLLTLMHTWQKLGKTVIVVLHDLEIVRKHFSWVMILARELIACGKTAEVLTANNWQTSQSFAEAYDEKASECIN